MSRLLDVYLKDKLVGHLRQENSGDLTFVYDADYLETAAQAISISLPLQSEAFTARSVKAFFSGLLPDESVRKRLAACLGLSEQNSFALLEAVGGDCAGALAIYPHGQKPSDSKHDIEVLDNPRLKEILELIKRRPLLAGNDGYRLSLAGAQDKLAVGFKDQKVYLIKGGAPTTHILKPLIEHSKDSTHNELFCMQLAKRLHIDVPQTMLHFVEDTPYYLVERYDRETDKERQVTCIHQEDFCQAMGLAPEIKYEREGGPSITACQAIITKYAARPAADQIKLLNRIIFNYLIGNADAHGKNFSLLYKGDKPELAPAYDLLSTAIYPGLSEKMAMKIAREYQPKNIYRRHFYKLVLDTKAAHSAINRQIQTMIEKITDEARTLKTSLEAEGLKSEVFGDIVKVIDQRILNLKE